MAGWRPARRPESRHGPWPSPPFNARAARDMPIRIGGLAHCMRTDCSEGPRKRQSQRSKSNSPPDAKPITTYRDCQLISISIHSPRIAKRCRCGPNPSSGSFTHKFQNFRHGSRVHFESRGMVRRINAASLGLSFCSITPQRFWWASDLRYEQRAGRERLRH